MAQTEEFDTQYDDAERTLREAAVDRLTRARDRQQALMPLRNLLSDADEEELAATVAGAAAGLSERGIAALLRVSQATVHARLDERRGAPLPPPAVATQFWALHHITAAIASQVSRLTGEQLPTAPGGGHVDPHQSTRTVRADLEESASLLAKIAASLDFTNRS